MGFGFDPWEAIGYLSTRVDELNNHTADSKKVDTLLQEIAKSFFDNYNGGQKEIARVSFKHFRSIKDSHYRSEVVRYYKEILDKKITELSQKNQFIFDEVV